MTTIDAGATIPSLEARLDEAARRFQLGKRTLIRSDGQPAYTDHQQRLAALQAEADAVFRDVQERARLAASAARAAAAPSRPRRRHRSRRVPSRTPPPRRRSASAADRRRELTRRIIPTPPRAGATVRAR